MPDSQYFITALPFLWVWCLFKMIAPVLIWLILCEHKQLLLIFICSRNHPFYGYHLLQVDSYLFIRISSSLSQRRSPAVYIYISTSAKHAWQTHIARGPATATLHFHIASLQTRRTGLNAKVPDGVRRGYAGAKGEKRDVREAARARREESDNEKVVWLWEQIDWVCIWAFRWVSIIRGKKMGSWPLKSIHGKGVSTVNINICACATARAVLDKPTAVNYELAYGEGDRLVNMQSWRNVRSSCSTSVRPPLHPEWQGLTWMSIISTGQATGHGLLGHDPKTVVWLTWKFTFLLDWSRG